MIDYHQPDFNTDRTARVMLVIAQCYKTVKGLRTHPILLITCMITDQDQDQFCYARAYWASH